MDALFQAPSRWVDRRQDGAPPLSWSGRLVGALLGLLARRIIARSVPVRSRHAIQRVGTPDDWPVRSDLLQRIKHVLETNGLSIPFLQRDADIVSQTAAGQ